MCKAPFWKLEFQSLPPTPYKHLYLWSDHRIKSVHLKPLRGWMRGQQKYLKCVRLEAKWSTKPSSFFGRIASAFWWEKD